MLNLVDLMSLIIPSSNFQRRFRCSYVVWIIIARISVVWWCLSVLFMSVYLCLLLRVPGWRVLLSAPQAPPGHSHRQPGQWCKQSASPSRAGSRAWPGPAVVTWPVCSGQREGYVTRVWAEDWVCAGPAAGAWQLSQLWQGWIFYSRIEWTWIQN